mmetsp:Transcript_37311/g.72855  ORF Transcript_37311/g.72855 Transcript_37311/m.72855 type:complete len:208 (+) Transcript_37311:218-841(+)
MRPPSHEPPSHAHAPLPVSSDGVEGSRGEEVQAVGASLPPIIVILPVCQEPTEPVESVGFLLRHDLRRGPHSHANAGLDPQRGAASGLGRGSEGALLQTCHRRQRPLLLVRHLNENLARLPRPPPHAPRLPPRLRPVDARRRRVLAAAARDTARRLHILVLPPSKVKGDGRAHTPTCSDPRLPFLLRRTRASHCRLSRSFSPCARSL